MKVLAIYAVNQHLADLLAEAHAERQARRANPRPSALRRAVAAARSLAASGANEPASASLTAGG